MEDRPRARRAGFWVNITYALYARVRAAGKYVQSMTFIARYAELRDRDGARRWSC